MTDGVVTPHGLAKYDIGPNHISRTGCPTITYHYLLDDLHTYKTCNHNNVTWHAGNWNPNSLAIALNYKSNKEWEKSQELGQVLDVDPRSVDEIPSDYLIDKLINLLTLLCIGERVSPNDIYGHRELKGTGWTLQKGSKKLRKSCPGFGVNLNYVRRSVAAGVQAELKDLLLYTGKIDGLFGKKSLAAFALL